MLDRMTKLIQTWDPFIPYDIEHIFESLDSILKFAQVKYPPQCIHLSLWNLANLTRIFRKYTMINIFYLIFYEY